MRTTAAVLTGAGSRFEITELELAPPGPGEVMVRIAAAGLCASDLNVRDGKRTAAPFPMVLGHEAAGVVVETGPGVTRVRPGDHAVLSITPYCGECARCHRGRPNYCDTTAAAMSAGTLLDGTSRMRRLDGERVHHFLTVSAFAEHAVVPQTGVIPIDPTMPLDRAALLSCAVLTGVGAAVNTAAVAPGARVAVFGCGGVGLNTVQGARFCGAERIIAVDVRAEKLDLAGRLGATDLVHASERDPVAAIRELTGGVDHAFEALGREETIRQAWRSLDIGGEVVIVGLLPNGAMLSIDADPFVNEQRVRGCYFGSATASRDVPALVRRYLDGELLLDEIISSRIGLTELDSAFDRLRAGDGARHVMVLD